LDSNHIAINNDGDKFTTLNELQLSVCLDTPPRCESNTAITPIRNAISCVGTSYITYAQACPLYQTTSAPIPRFYFFDNIMVYSTPTDTSIYIVYQPAPGQTSQKDQTISLRGYGLHKLAPACSLTLSDGTTHQTSTKTVNVTEVGSQLFREIFQRSQQDPEVVHIERTPVFSNMPRAKITLESGEDIVDLTKRLTDGFWIPSGHRNSKYSSDCVDIRNPGPMLLLQAQILLLQKKTLKYNCANSRIVQRTFQIDGFQKTTNKNQT
jgi:hypothetical protein